MLHYIKRDEKLQGCSRCLTEWGNKDPKSALGTQTAKGEGRDRSHNCDFPSVWVNAPSVAVPHTRTARLSLQLVVYRCWTLTFLAFSCNATTWFRVVLTQRKKKGDLQELASGITFIIKPSIGWKLFNSSNFPYLLGPSKEPIHLTI